MYPLNAMVWIAPTIFFLLIIGVPVIGVFAGWKRAAYWGGGTFFFFLLGSIIWRFAGVSIAGWLSPALNKWISSISPSATISDKFLISLSAPVFFLFVMLVGEIILVINYYAWFKKVSGIKKDIQAKKALKVLKSDKDKAKQVKQLKGWRQTQFTTKGKIINMACGGAGLGLLLAPSTVTFTQALLYTTTSVETRNDNSFISGFYNHMQSTLQPFNWMSYYTNNETHKDFNSLFSLLALSSEKTDYQHFNAQGTLISANDNALKAFTNIISGGFQTVIKQTVTEGQAETKLTTINNTITSFASQWNKLLEEHALSLDSVFNSENVSEILEHLIEDGASTKQQLTLDQITNYFIGTEGSESIFDLVIDYYYTTRPESEKFIQIPVSEETFANILAGFVGTVLLDSTVPEETKAEFIAKFALFVGLMFEVVE